ncbi:MAG: serine hydrolase [Planctomycetota bacterium]|nr:serine hydrolase [Planctomycetota bacterium]
MLLHLATLLLTTSAPQGPFDFTAAERLLQGELKQLQGDVAVLVHQDGHEVFRFQAGAIDFDTQVRMASLTKTISAGVILSMVDAGELELDTTLGQGLPLLFRGKDVGEPTVLDCWAMRHGITAPQAYEHLAFFGLGASVAMIGSKGTLDFRPGSHLGYDGKGMQATALIAEKRSGLAWGDLARERVLAPCGMTTTDYLQFDPNPAVAGGLRSTAEEVLAYADMVLAGGVVGAERVLSEASVERLFTNHTSGLPVHFTPFPKSHPSYPYGTPPDYGFGTWVLAQNPGSGHVEEVVGAGAWGSYVWLDRRRGLTAVMIVDVPAGSKRSIDAALGLAAAARAAVQARQATALTAKAGGTAGATELTWKPAPGSSGSRVYGSSEPLLDLFDLRAASLCYEGDAASASVASFPHYAVLSDLGGHENTALIPGVNTTAVPTPR